jgi:RHS repeat-associated protein
MTAFSAARALFATLAVALICASAAAQPVVTYFHNDLSGSPAMATDAAGQMLWKESYRPYGSKHTNGAESNKDAIGFTGRPFDAATGLSYMDARYYDPVLGRFMGVDPAAAAPGNVHSINRYAYANNSPLKYVDPDGNSPLDVAFLVWDPGKLSVAVYTGIGVGGAPQRRHRRRRSTRQWTARRSPMRATRPTKALRRTGSTTSSAVATPSRAACNTCPCPPSAAPAQTSTPARRCGSSSAR